MYIHLIYIYIYIYVLYIYITPFFPYVPGWFDPTLVVSSRRPSGASISALVFVALVLSDACNSGGKMSGGSTRWVDGWWLQLRFIRYPLVNIQKAIENCHL